MLRASLYILIGFLISISSFARPQTNNTLSQFYLDAVVHSDKIESVINYSDKNWTSGSPSNTFGNSEFWVKLNLDITNNLKNNLVLELENPNLSIVDFYLFSDQKLITSTKTGTFRARSTRDLSDNYFSFVIESEKKPTAVYLNIKTGGFNKISPKLISQKDWIKSSKGRHGWNMFFLGALCFLFMYFSSIYLFSKERQFIVYATLALLLMLLNILSNGYLSYFLNNTPNSFSFRAISVLIPFLIYTLFEVVASFRNLEKHNPMIHQFNKIFSTSCLALTLFSVQPFYHELIKIEIFLFSITLIIIIVEVIYLIKQGNRNFYWVGLGMSIYLIGAFINLSVKAGYLPDYNIILNSNQWAILVCFILLSIKVVDKLNFERREKMKALEKSNDFNNRYYDIFINAEEGIFTTKLDGTITEANPSFCQMVELIDPIGANISNFINQKLLDKIASEINLHSRIKNKEVSFKTHSGRNFHISLNIRKDVHQQPALYRGSIIDISELKATEQKIDYLANHEQATGLMNRNAFKKEIASALKHKEDQQIAVLFMDIDQFKVINDTCGHAAGDTLMKNIAEHMEKQFERFGAIAHLGGDKFGLLTTNLSTSHVTKLATKIKETVNEFRFNWSGQIFNLTISIGLVVKEPDEDLPEDLLSLADSACYQAKESGRNRIHIFSNSDVDLLKTQSDMSWVSIINDALLNNRFVLFFQTIQSINDNSEGEHFEILLRMRDQYGGLVPPGEFLPAAERYNLMERIDLWVVENFFQWLAKSPEYLPLLGVASINLSGASLNNANSEAAIIQLFDKYKVPSNKICFEITESMAIVNFETTQRFIQNFRKLGVRFSLDDFGTGMSSYAYLKNLPVDYLKIDGSFVKDITTSVADAAMVKSIHDVGKALNMETIAEFVENDDIVKELKSIGVDYAQGYGVGKPKPIDVLYEHSN